MILELLDQTDFEALPAEAGPRWVALEGLARTRLHMALELEDKSGRNGRNLILQYMHVVATAANELGIENISIPGGNDPSTQIDHFMIAVQSAATRVWLGSTVEPGSIGISVSDDAKEAIRTLVVRIHSQIPNLGLTDRQEKRLTASLSNFSQELELPKSRFSVGSGHLVAALTVLNLTITTTASGPEAYEAIQKIQTIWGE